MGEDIEVERDGNNPFAPIYIPLARAIADLWYAGISSGSFTADALVKSVDGLRSICSEAFPDARVCDDIIEIIEDGLPK